MESQPSAVGQILQGTYRIERLLGTGGMGTVYCAKHTRIRKCFAIKMLSPEVAENEEALARFHREAQVTSALGHPHIVEVMDFNHTKTGIPFLVMELLEGQDLEGRLRGKDWLDFYDASAIFAQTALALEAAHEHNIVHRDLKPQNIFLCDRENTPNYVKVLDFGISKVLDSTNAVTRVNALMGTPAYMSPEVAEGRAAEVDRRTDIYSLGVIVYEMLAGQPPFMDDNMLIILNKILGDKPPSICNERPEIPQAIEDVVFKALAKQPEDRYDTMSEFWGAFEAAARAERLPCYGGGNGAAQAVPDISSLARLSTRSAPDLAQPLVEGTSDLNEFDEFEATIPDLSPPSLLDGYAETQAQGMGLEEQTKAHSRTTIITQILRRSDTQFAALAVGLFAIGSLLGWAWRRNVSAAQGNDPSAQQSQVEPAAGQRTTKPATRTPAPSAVVPRAAVISAATAQHATTTASSTTADRSAGAEMAATPIAEPENKRPDGGDQRAAAPAHLQNVDAAPPTPIDIARKEASEAQPEMVPTTASDPAKKVAKSRPRKRTRKSTRRPRSRRKARLRRSRKKQPRKKAPSDDLLDF